MTTPRWSPAQVLQLNPNSLDSTCMGHAKTQGRRCRNPIAYANRQEAAKILLQISRFRPQSQRVDDKFEELASCLLCKRWHQNQAAEMKEKWHRRIEYHQATEGARRRETRAAQMPAALIQAPTTAASSAARSRTVHTRIECVTSSITSSVTHESSTLVVQSIVIQRESRIEENNQPDEEEQTRQQANPEPVPSSQQETSPQETANHQSNTPIPTASTDRPTIQTLAPSLQQHLVVPREDEQEATHEAQPAPPLPSAPQTPHSQREDSHPSHHDRRPIEGDCSICCEALSSGEITWCRAQCRQNFHTECVSLWHASLEVDGRIKTCPYW